MFLTDLDFFRHVWPGFRFELLLSFAALLAIHHTTFKWRLSFIMCLLFQRQPVHSH